MCSRGGDLTMLEVLTESDETNEGKARVAEILDEQRKTLRFVMSRPQVLLLLNANFAKHCRFFCNLSDSICLIRNSFGIGYRKQQNGRESYEGN